MNDDERSVHFPPKAAVRHRPIADVTYLAHTGAMHIKELRACVDTALAQEGLENKKLASIGPKVWALPGNEVIRFFSPHAYRRPWGFVFAGLIGLEIPALRTWLQEHKSPEQAGIFRSYFVGYHTANDDSLRGFIINHGDRVPADLWAGLIADRLRELPDQSMR